MLVNQYRISNDKGVFDHYEYIVDRSSTGIDPETSLPIFGIALVEKHISGILGARVCFFLLHESRFLSYDLALAEEIGLDISLHTIDNKSYNIIAEITSNGNVLAEIAGKAAAP